MQPETPGPLDCVKQPLHDSSWHDLAVRIQQDDVEAMSELYRILDRGMRSFLLRSLGSQEAKDVLHEGYLAVVERIREGELREPGALLSFALSTLRNKVAAQIGKVARRRRTEIDLDVSVTLADSWLDPEQLVLLGQRREIAGVILNELPLRDREILFRFYILEEDRQKICSELGLSETQFRLLKSRAKARLGRMWNERSATVQTRRGST